MRSVRDVPGFASSGAEQHGEHGARAADRGLHRLDRRRRRRWRQRWRADAADRLDAPGSAVIETTGPWATTVLSGPANRAARRRPAAPSAARRCAAVEVVADRLPVGKDADTVTPPPARRVTVAPGRAVAAWNSASRTRGGTGAASRWAISDQLLDRAARASGRRARSRARHQRRSGRMPAQQHLARNGGEAPSRPARARRALPPRRSGAPAAGGR